MSHHTTSPIRRHASRVRAAFARLGAGASLFALMTIAACAGGSEKSLTEPVTPPVVTPPTGGDPTTPTPTGIAAVAPTGLPAGVNGRLVLKSGSIEHLLVGTSSVAGLTPGQWVATAQTVVADGVIYEPTPVTQNVTVTSSGTTNIVVTYAPNTGTLNVAVTGLPTSGSGDVTVTGPDNFRRTFGNTIAINALTPGKYHVEARGVKLAAGSYAPSTAQQDIDVAAGNTAATVNVAYVLAPSIVNVVITGLPGGSNAAVTLTPPSGSNIAVMASTRLPAALAGRWQLAAASVKSSGFTWIPSPTAKDTTVSAGDSIKFDVQYTIATGGIAFLVTGLPGGVDGAIRVSGPAGYQRTITETVTLTDLAPGVYTVASDSVQGGNLTYRASTPTQTITVAASLTASAATINYSAAVATLTVGMNGVPVGATNMVEVTGPNGFDRFISGTTKFNNVTPGVYTVISSPIILPGGVRYEGSPNSQTRTLTFGSTDSVTVTYARAGGKAAITVNGLPNGTNAAITLTGNGTTTPITGSMTFDNLAPATYTLAASPVTVGATVYNPTPASTPVTITTGTTTSATVTYAAVVVAPTTGSAAITVTGLPNGVNAAITFAGGSVNSVITGTITLNNLAPVTYTLTASPVTVSGTVYTPSPTTRAVTIAAGFTTSASIVYSASVTPPTPPVGGGGTNLILDGFYLTQATQKMDGSVAMVAGRDALLRVFVHANEANTLQPSVRVRIYDGSTLLQTLTLTAPESSVRTALAESQLNSTWNSVIAGANVRTTMRIVADVDPADAVTESDETDNSWPRNGTPQTMTVNAVPTFNVRFVPVTVGSLTGNVSNANKEQFLASTRRMHPINDISSDVRAPFTSSASVLQSGDGNNAWLTVLQEMNALRTADGAPANMHYYGVVKVGYSSGVAGYGYVPGRAAMGWDYLPSGDGVAVHEWGHNFGRPHTNCGGPDSPDPSYPYAGGTIGQWGWNPSTGILVSPTATDVMGYCNNQWTSDWTWTKVMNYRATSGMVASASVFGAKQDGLLVWGRIVNGKVTLEPSFRVMSRPTPAAAAGTHRLQALDANGNSLLDLPITADKVDHVLDRDERHFAVVVPWSAAMETALATLRVSDIRQPFSVGSMTSATMTRGAIGGVLLGAQASGARTMPAASATVGAISASRSRIQWDKSAYPMAVARDASTGEIMAFVRNPGDIIVTNGRKIELVFSDGVRSRIEKP